MAGGSGSNHEPYELLSEETKNMHRAIVTVMEEFEAIDWYQQRAEGCSDEELKKILLHNKKEEMEHAMMTVEWIRRKNADFSEQAKRYMFSNGPITEIEKNEMGLENRGSGEHHRKSHQGSAHHEHGSNANDGSLGIGGLKREVRR